MVLINIQLDFLIGELVRMECDPHYPIGKKGWSLAHGMAWQVGNTPSPESTMIPLTANVCVARPQCEDHLFGSVIDMTSHNSILGSMGFVLGGTSINNINKPHLQSMCTDIARSSYKIYDNGCFRTLTTTMLVIHSYLCTSGNIATAHPTARHRSVPDHQQPQYR